MRRTFLSILLLFILGSAMAATNTTSKAKKVDLDLTKFNTNMVYVQLYNIMADPSEYIGKTIKVQGSFYVDQNPYTGRYYFLAVVSDATACCLQGMEFILSGEHTYPDDYPPVDSQIEICGEMKTYNDDGWDYPYLEIDTIKTL